MNFVIYYWLKEEEFRLVWTETSAGETKNGKNIVIELVACILKVRCFQVRSHVYLYVTSHVKFVGNSGFQCAV